MFPRPMPAPPKKTPKAEKESVTTDDAGESASRKAPPPPKKKKRKTSGIFTICILFALALVAMILLSGHFGLKHLPVPGPPAEEWLDQAKENPTSSNSVLFASRAAKSDSAEIANEARELLTKLPIPFVWSTPAPEEDMIIGHPNSVESIDLSPDGRWLACGLYDRSIQVWDLATGEQSKALPSKFGPVSSVSFSPDGQKIAFGSAKTLGVWEWNSGLEHKLHDVSGWVSSVALSPDGMTLVASGDARCEVVSWNLAKGELRSSEKPTKAAPSITFSPDGSQIARSSGVGKIEIWNREMKGEPSLSLKTDSSYPFSSLAYSGDGKHIAASSYDLVAIFDAKTGKSRLTLANDSTRMGSGLAFSPKNDLIAIGLFDGSIVVCKADTGVEQVRFYGHTRPVTSLKFGPDASFLASGSSDGTAKLWQLQQTEGERPDLHPFVEGNWVHFQQKAVGLIWKNNKAALPYLDRNLANQSWLGVLRNPETNDENRQLKLLRHALSTQSWKSAVYLHQNLNSTDAEAQSKHPSQAIAAEELSAAWQKARVANDSQTASQLLAKGNLLVPNEKGWSLAFGSWLQESGNQDEALSAFMQMNNTTGWRAAANMQTGEDAWNTWRLILDSNEAIAEDFFTAGAVAIELEKFDEHQTLRDDAIAKFADEAGKLNHEFGRNLCSAEAHEEAIGYFRDAITSPGNGLHLSAAYDDLATALDACGRDDEAWDAYEMILDQKDAGPIHLANAARYAAALGGQEEAETIFARAVASSETKSDREKVHRLRGWSMIDLENYEAARNEFEVAEKLCDEEKEAAPHSGSDLLTGLAASAWLMQTPDSAVKHYEGLLNLDSELWKNGAHIESLARSGVVRAALSSTLDLIGHE